MRQRRFWTRPPLAALVTLLLAAPFAAPPLLADWIVGRDGSRIETKGKWKVEGNRVVFQLPNGTMGVMRKSEVDLDASAAASSEAVVAAEKASAPVKAPPPKRQAVLTLTDKDIPRARPEPTADQPAPAGGDAADPSSPRPAAVEVVQWRQATGEDGSIEIGGLVKNVGSDVAANISLQVELTDENGKTHTAVGFLDRSSLVRDKDTNFRAIFPEVRQVGRPPVFKLSADAATIGLGKDKPAAGGEATDETVDEEPPEGK